MELLIVVILVVLLGLLLLGVSVPVALFASGGLGLVVLRGVDGALIQIGRVTYSMVSSYSLAVVPLFVLIGMLAMRGGLATDVYGLAARKLRGIPGGLGIATVAASSTFAAVSGSSLATAVTLGRVSIGEMRKHGYDGGFAAGIVAASGTLGVLIPPSIFLVLYAIVAGESIGAMLLAGIIPGILSAILYVAAIAIRARTRSRMFTGAAVSGKGAAGTSTNPGDPHSSGEDHGTDIDTVPRRAQEIRSLALIGIIFTIIMGGIYAGVFTVTESAAVAVLACLVLVPLNLRLRSSSFAGVGRVLLNAFRETASLVSMVFAIVVGATVFSAFLVSAGLTGQIASMVAGLQWPPWAIAALFLLLAIPLGMFLDPLSMMLILTPIAHPVLTALGFDGIWFGILMVKMIELSLVTPPLGLNVFVVAAIDPDLTVEDVFRGVSWFFGFDLLTIALIFVAPAIVLWLPSQLS